MIVAKWMASPLGGLYVAGDNENLTGLWLEGQKYFAATLDPGTPEGDSPVFEQVKKWLDVYFSGKEPDFLPRLAPKGSSFRAMVWDILLDIPYGETLTYGEIAKRLEKSTGKTGFRSGRGRGCRTQPDKRHYSLPSCGRL